MNSNEQHEAPQVPEESSSAPQASKAGEGDSAASPQQEAGEQSTGNGQMALSGEFDDIGPRGRAENAKPLDQFGDQIIRWRDCPDCDGRGWFLHDPFATSPWPAGYVCQCQTCANAKAFHDEHGRLPRLSSRKGATVQ